MAAAPLAALTSASRSLYMLFLRTFGSTCLLDEEKHVVVSEQRRRLALLALLASAGEGGVTRDKLLAYLWPESSTQNARHALHQLLYYLRRDAGPQLFAGTDPLRLNPEAVRSDVAQFTKAIAAGSLDEAVAIYGGPFLDGFFVTEAPEFEKWVESQRAKLHGQFTRALHELARAADERNAGSLAIERWRALVAAEPLDARATLGLMRALAAAGDPGAALRQGRAYEQLVSAETGQPCAAEILTQISELNAVHSSSESKPQRHIREQAPAVVPVISSSDTVRNVRRSRFNRTAPAFGGAAALVIFIGGYNAFHMRATPSASEPERITAAAPAIAILPFGVNDTAMQAWRKGVLVSLASDVDGVAGMRAIMPQTILAALGEQTGSAVSISAAPDRTQTLRVAQRVGARYAVAGNVTTIGRVVRITADLYETASGTRLQQLQSQGPAEHMFALLDRLAIGVLQATLRRERKDADLTRIDLARGATTSLPALKAYLLGEELYQQSRFKEAAQQYESALQADSTFVLMFSRFLVPYSYVGEATPKSMPDPLAHALRMIDRLPHRDALLVRANLELSRDHVPAAFALLRQASREYPEDYEVWYSLGEVALHEAPDLLLGPEDALRAFSTAIQLNPSFGPPYAHLIELTLGERGDSARAFQLNSAYERLAPEADNVAWGRLTLALAFGSPAARANALAALDTLPSAVVMQLAKYLSQPRFRHVQEQLLGLVAERDHWRGSPPKHDFRTSAHISLGQLSAAVASALDSDGCPAYSIYWAHLVGLTQLPPEAAAAFQSGTSRLDACPKGIDVFAAGAYAADRKRWQSVDSSRVVLGLLAKRQLAAGDSLNARQTRLLSEALHGYQAARSGDVDEGIRTLRSVQPRLASSDIVRWWLGNLLLESGHPNEARKYFASFWDDKRFIPANYSLGRIDEQLGNYTQARAEYARFADGWRNADREVQPRIVEARVRIAALDQRR